jgi:hypothetical protein
LNIIIKGPLEEGIEGMLVHYIQNINLTPKSQCTI